MPTTESLPEIVRDELARLYRAQSSLAQMITTLPHTPFNTRAANAHIVEMAVAINRLDELERHGEMSALDLPWRACDALEIKTLSRLAAQAFGGAEWSRLLFVGGAISTMIQFVPA